MIASAALSRMQSYIDGVLSGEIVVGELVRLAVQRHVADLDRQSTQGFPFHFDADHASIAIEFFGLALRHSIGDFAGQPFELEPWQAFGIGSIQGWKRDTDNGRRFQTVYWAQARKNGKSTVAAGIAILVASMDINPETLEVEQVAEVILCATKKEQAEKVTFAEALRMRAASEHLSAISTDINRQITFTHNHGFIRCVGSDKPFDGLNTLCSIKDELHAWREHHRPFYDTISTGGGSRSQPLDITTTTAGDKNSKIWLEEYERVQKVLRGIITDESIFALAYEIDQDDDPLDEACWPKANPNLGVCLKLEYLRKQAKKADTAIGLNRFKRYHCNIVVDAIEKAIDLNKWDKCKGSISDWDEADAVGAGVDLGWRDDLASYGLVARFQIGEIEPEDEDGDPVPLYRYEARSVSVMFDDTKRDLTGPPWAQWCHDDAIVRTPYPISELTRRLQDDWRRYHVHDGAYDPANGQMLGEEMDQNGYTFASMSQNYRFFNEPIRELLKAVTDGRVTHNGDPVLRWCANNAVLKKHNDLWMFDKEHSADKIDAIVAVTMAFWRAMVAPPKVTGALYIA